MNIHKYKKQYKLCLAAHIGISPPPSCGLPSLRCLGLGRSIIMTQFRSWHLILPKDHSHTAKIARIYQRLVMAHCIVLLFPFRLNKVMYLYCCMQFSRFIFRILQSPLLISRKQGTFYNLFAKFFCVFFNTKRIPIFLLRIAKIPLTYKPKNEVFYD